MMVSFRCRGWCVETYLDLHLHLNMHLAPCTLHLAPASFNGAPYTRHARLNLVGGWAGGYWPCAESKKGKEVARLAISPYPFILKQKEQPKSFTRCLGKYPGVCPGSARGRAVVQAFAWQS